MKKLIKLNLGKNLSRAEMKNINGGSIEYLDDGAFKCAETPTDKCQTTSECRVRYVYSYCYTHTCEQNGVSVSYKSCQYLRD